MPEETVKGSPLLIVDTLINCHPSVTLRLTLCRNSTCCSGISCARLTVKECVMSNVEGPRSGCVSNGFWGAACENAPTVLVTDVPATVLVSSIDLDQV